MDDYLKIAILCGGWSDERLISLKSGESVHKCLIDNNVKSKLFDFKINDKLLLYKFLKDNSINLVFNLMHGTGGEDGTVQEYLESISMKYIGSNSLSSKISFNKLKSKECWISNNINTPKYIPLTRENLNVKLISTLGDKVVLKPSESGSSVGIKILSSKKIFDTKNSRELIELEKLCVNSDLSEPIYFLEEYINYNEYTAPIIKNKIFPVIKIDTKREFYDYNAKYIDDDTSFTFPVFDTDYQKMINDTVLQAFKSLGCSDWGRVDFFMNDDGKIQLIEINSIPGMTDHSLVPMSAKKNNLNYYDLLKILLDI